MEKLKIITAFIFGCISCFMYGAYTDSVLFTNNVVEPHQWALTGIFGIFFFVYVFSKLKIKK